MARLRCNDLTIRAVAVPGCFALSLCTCEQLGHLLVGRLLEISVPDTDGTEAIRRLGADRLVGLGGQLVARRRFPDRYRDDDSLRTQSPDGEHRGPHRGTGCAAIVDEDRHSVTHLGSCILSAIHALSTLELASLVIRRRRDHVA